MRRRRALALLVLLAVLVHVAFVGGIGSLSIGASEPPTAPVVAVRTIEAAPPAEAVAALPTRPETAPEPATQAPPRAAPVAVPPKRPRALREPSRQQALTSTNAAEVPSRDVDPAEAAAEAASGSASAVSIAAVVPAAAAPPVSTTSAASVASEPAPAAPASAPQSLLAAGEEPPPTYRPLLPPPMRLLYEVRRGFLRGTGEIRWQPDGERYSLVLQARIAGVTLMTQSSEGAIDAGGLEPQRFVDQRARRGAQAANFRRDTGVVSYSGPQTQWALLPGAQDGLSWMIQLAGIVAAEPQLLTDGGRVTMVVVGARGDASVWTLRYAGEENVETATGTVHAVKLVREARSVSDAGAEIWLDPAHGYLPAHATRRNSAGESEYDLLLERIEPGG